MGWSGWYILYQTWLLTTVGISILSTLLTRKPCTSLTPYRPSIQFPRDYWVYTENAVDALSIYDGVSSTLLVPRLWVSSLHTTNDYGIDLVE